MDKYREKRLHSDEEITTPQDDLYIITWETNFGEQLATRGNKSIPTSLPNGEQPVTSRGDSSDARANEASYIITSDNSNDAVQRQNERSTDNVCERNELIEAESNDNSDWLNSTVCHKN